MKQRKSRRAKKILKLKRIAHLITQKKTNVKPKFNQNKTDQQQLPANVVADVPVAAAVQQNVEQINYDVDTSQKVNLFFIGDSDEDEEFEQYYDEGEGDSPQNDYYRETEEDDDEKYSDEEDSEEQYYVDDAYEEAYEEAEAEDQSDDDDVDYRSIEDVKEQLDIHNSLKKIFKKDLDDDEPVIVLQSQLSAEAMEELKIINKKYQTLQAKLNKRKKETKESNRRKKQSELLNSVMNKADLIHHLNKLFEENRTNEEKEQSEIMDKRPHVRFSEQIQVIPYAYEDPTVLINPQHVFFEPLAEDKSEKTQENEFSQEKIQENIKLLEDLIRKQEQKIEKDEDECENVGSEYDPK